MDDKRADAMSNAEPTLQLHCRVDSTMLCLLREFVCTVARHLEFTEAQVAEIEISVDEACANVVEHAYSQRVKDDPAIKDLFVDIQYSGDEMDIRIIDQGDGGASAKDDHFHSLDEYLTADRQSYRGLGLLLMRKFMDNVQIYSTPGKGTTVELKKLRYK